MEYFCMMIRRMERTGRFPINIGRIECQKTLDAGRPVYYGNENLADGEVIKEYPDGRKELVTFNLETGEEIYLRDYATP